MNNEEAAAIVGWRERRINNLTVTAIMLLCLRDMKAAKDADYSGVFLMVHKATLNALLRHDWAIYLERPDGDMYAITSRGERVLTLFSLPLASRRSDGICPVCCERPKHVYPSGKTAGYCYECEKESKRRQRAMGRPRLNPDRMCSRCQKRPLLVEKSGRLRTYCEHCWKIMRRRERKRRRARARKAIESGNPPLCYQCKTEPVYYTEKSVYDLCYACYREYQNEYNRKRQDRRRAQ